MDRALEVATGVSGRMRRALQSGGGGREMIASCWVLAAMVRPPCQQAATLSGWPSSRTACSTIFAASQSRPPNAEARATPASRTAAEEPHPMPTGMPLTMRSSSGTTGLCSEARTNSYVWINRFLFKPPQTLGFRPVATMENRSAGTASISRKSSSASAIASKPGPRLAEVAGSRSCTLFMLSSSLDGRLEDAKHGIGGGLEREHWTALLRYLLLLPGTLFRAQQFPLMKIDGELRILEGVAGKQEHNGFGGVDLALAHQLFQARQGSGGCRLAADTLLANLRFGHGNLRFAHLFAIAASLADDSGRLAPGSRVSYTDGGGPGGGLHGLDFAPVMVQQAEVKRVGALGLHHGDFRDLVAEA